MAILPVFTLVSVPGRTVLCALQMDSLPSSTARLFSTQSPKALTVPVKLLDTVESLRGVDGFLRNPNGKLVDTPRVSSQAPA